MGCCLDSFYVGKAEEVSLSGKIVRVNGNSIAFDYLVLASGAETNFYDVAGAEENCFTLKSLEDAIRLKNHSIDMVDKASFIGKTEERKKMLCFAIIGGGPTGVELSAEMQEFFWGTFSRYYNKEIINNISVVLIQRDKEILPQFKENLRGKSLKTLEKNGVKVILGSAVEKVSPDSILLSNGSIIYTKTPIWVAGVKPSDISLDKDVERESDGRIKVNQYLQVEKHPFAYVLGDLAGVKKPDGTLFPMLAQVAVKEAKIAAQNIKLQIEGSVKLRQFGYELSGSLVSLGKWNAIGNIFNLYLSGFLAWFVWRTIYLSKLISWQKKVKVAVAWSVSFFSPRDISKL